MAARRTTARSVSPGAALEARTRRQATQSPTRSRLESHLRSLSKLQGHIQVEAQLSASRSKVLLGKDRSGQCVAVKAISLKTAKVLGIDERCLWGEVQVMREVQHPNLVRLLDALVSWEPLPMVRDEPPFLCIVTEYLANTETLSQRIRQCLPQRLPLQLVERILQQLASALARLHRSDVVHRDVWVENILIEKQSDKVTLLDLGCAERVQRPMLNNKLNIPYMSPEAAAGRPHDVTDDAWALGLLVTEIVTGRFVGDRLGRTDLPIHASPALSSALSETAQAAPQLGVLATQLLDTIPARRPKMADVVNYWRPGSRKDAALARQVPKEKLKGPRPVSVRPSPSSGSLSSRPWSPLGFRGRLCTSQRVSPVRGNRVQVDVSPGRPRAPCSPMRNGKVVATGAKEVPEAVASTFRPGQSVLYCPKEAAGVQKAHVLGRSVDGKGWQIQLENGPICVVADAEEWRLCLCDEQRPPAPITEGPVLAWAQEASRAGKVLSTSSTVSSLATAQTGSTAATEATDSTQPARSVKVAAVRGQASLTRIFASPSPMRPTTPVAANLRPAVTPAAPAPAPIFISKSLSEAGPMLRARPRGPGQVGQRLVYTRSSGQRYAGVLRGFLPAGGYQIFLDCGEHTIVEESEAWRLAF